MARVMAEACLEQILEVKAFVRIYNNSYLSGALFFQHSISNDHYKVRNQCGVLSSQQSETEVSRSCASVCEAYCTLLNGGAPCVITNKFCGRGDPAVGVQKLLMILVAKGGERRLQNQYF